MRNSKPTISIAAAALLMGVSIPAGAVSARQQNQAARPKQRQAALAQRERTGIPLLPAAKVVGRRVTDPKGHDAGRVDSMVLDTKSGTVEYLIIGGRGNFNLNGQLIAVPWSEIQRPRARGSIDSKIAARQLEKAPRINRGIIYELVTRNGRARIYGYYGSPYPYYGSPGWYWPYRRPYPPGGLATAPAAAHNATTGMAATAQNNGSTATRRNAQAGSMAARGRQAERQAAKKAQAHAQHNRQQAAAEPANNLTVDQNGVVSMLMKSGTVSPSLLHAANVYDDNDKLIGQVDQALIDTRSGHIAYVLIKRGGFLGLNPTWFAVPPEALHWSLRNAGYGYRLTISRRKLMSVPSVPANRAHLTTFVPRQQLAELYQHFGIKPYWTGQGAAENRHANNNGTTGQNTGETSH